MNNTKFLTVKEVAERLRVSRSLVYQLVDSGRLASHRIGGSLRGSIRISEHDLHLYLDCCRKETGEEARKPPRPRLKHLKL